MCPGKVAPTFIAVEGFVGILSSNETKTHWPDVEHGTSVGENTYLSILVDGFRVQLQSRGDHGPLACGILSSSSDIEGCLAVVKWSHMD